MTLDVSKVNIDTCPVVAHVVSQYCNIIHDDTFRIAEMGRLLPRLPGTQATPSVERSRWRMVLDWNMRSYLPVLLRACGIRGDADSVASLGPLTGAYYFKFTLPEVGVSTASARCLHNMALLHGCARSVDEYFSLAPYCIGNVKHYVTEATDDEARLLYATISTLIDRMLA